MRSPFPLSATTRRDTLADDSTWLGGHCGLVNMVPLLVFLRKKLAVWGRDTLFLEGVELMTDDD